ncbi:sensor histidine kinase [Actinomadura chibensis]|uniref:histidine kinase n=1 Tax=Actinomadura chibensis TaxID=392828 RepID=A0A5D0NW76_9ACTN|nr:sensor histidine kinase [Actinomadura chibensis]TYB48512.1 sensor histidine kinase [Actinomadura chibensis]
MTTSWRRFADRHPRVAEAGFLLLVYTITIGQYIDTAAGWWPGTLPATAACLSLVWRDRHPGAVASFVVFCTVVTGGTGYPVTHKYMIPLVVAFYALGVRVPERVARVYGVIGIVVFAAAAQWAVEDDQAQKVATFAPAFWIIVALVSGAAVRGRRAYLDAAHARAEHAERTREEEARHRVAAERVRIARELHDVVAHHMALANAQAGTAAHIVRTDPEQAGEILGELSRTTAAALRELQAAVGLLRRSDDPESLEPSPGLGRLDELVSAFDSAGLRATVTVDGERRPLSPGVDLAAFRIVQEALTNVAKHAGADTAEVRLSYDGDTLTVTVSDDGGAGPRPAASGGGFGLIGMRERARSAGGRLRAGRRPEGGFAVTAELPIHS